MLRTARPGLACLGVFILLTPGLAQVRTIDTERELSTRFGFTSAEMDALVGARARSSMLSGVAARLLRGRVESATWDTTKTYLEWIRQSVSAERWRAKALLMN